MKQTKERPGVMVYFHLTQPLTELTDSQFGRLMRALLEYAQYGVVPRFDEQVLAMLWGFFRHASDVDKERYDQRCASARAAVNKRWGKDTDASDGIPTIPKTQTDPQTETDQKADADAHTHASASAQTTAQDKAGTASEPAAEGPPSDPAGDTAATDARPSYEVPFRAGQDFEAWRQEQIAAITAHNNALRLKDQTERSA